MRSCGQIAKSWKEIEKRKAASQNTAIIGVHMGLPEPPHRSKVPWALAVTVGLCSGLAGYVIHAARVNRIPKQVVTVRRLTDMPGPEEMPAISPDGTKVAFVAMSRGKQQIWVLRIGGGSPRAITDDETDHVGPRWSTDSNSMIYFANSSIWEIGATGGETRKLADALAPGDLNHDGKLAFFRREDGGVELIADGHPVATLTGGTFSNLRWSPDHKRIAYLQDMTIMVVDSSGGEPVRASDAAVQGFTWAPDDSGLIVSSISTKGELWFVPRVEGRLPSQLTFGELSYESPDLSPKGTLVASRRGLATGADADIVLFTGLKW
jgi:dipeptidyl aminopeptidase/acylaminoacyl peptidase